MESFTEHLGERAPRLEQFVTWRGMHTGAVVVVAKQPQWLTRRMGTRPMTSARHLICRPTIWKPTGRPSDILLQLLTAGFDTTLTDHADAAPSAAPRG